MSYLSCCFSVRDARDEQKELAKERQPLQTVVATCEGRANPFDDKHICEDAPTEKAQQQQAISITRYHTSGASQLQKLQLALNAIEGVGFEARCPQLISCIQDCLDSSAVVRLYGLTSQGSDLPVQHLVQLAASKARSGHTRPTSGDGGLPGRSFTLSLSGGIRPRSAQGDLTSSRAGSDGLGAQFVDAPFTGLLMERALSSAAPALYYLNRETGRGVLQPYCPDHAAAAVALPVGPTSPPGAQAQPRSQGQPPQALSPHSQLPRDCLTEVATLPGCQPVLFAALPLSCGRRPVGVLWIATTEPERTDGREVDTPSPDDSAAAAAGTGGGPMAAWVKAADAVSAAAVAERLRRDTTLLYDSGALSQLALSFSMALAAAMPDPDYLSWLAGALRRMAKCSNLHTLVAGVCTAVARHVRWKFHVDVAVQSALVPEPDTQVAFMLYPETKQSGAAVQARSGGIEGVEAATPATGETGPAAGGGGRRGEAGPATTTDYVVPSYETTYARARSGVLATCRPIKTVRRTASQAAVLQRPNPLTTSPEAAACTPNSPPDESCGTAGGRSPGGYVAHAHDNHHHHLRQQQQQQSHLQPCQRQPMYDSSISPAPNPARLRRLSLVAPFHALLRGKDPDASSGGGSGSVAAAGAAPGGSGASRDAATGGGRCLRGASFTTTSAPAVLFSLSAKAFQVSHTLLYRLISTWARAKGRPGLRVSPGRGAVATAPGGKGMPYGNGRVAPGIVVTDTARHVADVRQPSRDICMLLGSKAVLPAAVTAALWSSGPSSGGGRGGLPCGTDADPLGGSGRSGAASLVLMAMEVAEGGCMLGLYIAFPTLTPQPLLAAARDSCGHFVSQMLADLVWCKLQSPELGSDFETLRAGVPGSYMSFSRLRDAVDRLQIPRTLNAPDTPCVALRPHASGPHPHPLMGLGPGGGDDGVGTDPRDVSRGQAAKLLMDSVMTTADAAGLHAAAAMQSGAGGGCGPGLGSSGMPRDVEPGGQGPKRNLLEDLRRKGGSSSPFASSIARRLFGQAVGSNGGGAGCAGGAVAPRTGSFSAATAAPVGAGGGGGQQHMSTFGNILSATGLPSCGSGVAAGLPSGGASTLMLDSVADAAGDPRVGPTHSMMTVHDLDDAWGMRGIMGALVESIMTTLRVSASQLGEAVNGMDLAARATEGLEDLQLIEVLGHGASGVVLRGTLGTVPVAVKLMEMPDADQDSLSTEVSCLANRQCTSANQHNHQNNAVDNCYHQPPSPNPSAAVKSLACMGEAGETAANNSITPRAGAGGARGGDADGRSTAGARGGCSAGSAAACCSAPPQPSEADQVRARRTMMRNATELAVMRTISHVSIVQAFAVYDNVIMERTPDMLDGFALRRLDSKNPETGGSPICTAIVQELCDRGSLADVLADRSFPALLQPASTAVNVALSPQQLQQQPPAARSANSVLGGVRLAATRGAGGGARLEADMRGVYLTLLEIALALRHLHARRLVHRDVKPANILLKGSQGDPRGWTCKLADFGFALVLDQQEPLQDPKDAAELANPLLLPAPGISPKLLGSTGSTGSGGRGWCTVQAQACGTVTHMAPEAMVKNSRINASVDVYSLGIICWELVCGRGQRPYRHLDLDAIPNAVRAGLRPTFTEDVPTAYRKLAMACWAQEPQRRPRAADVVSYVKSQLAQLHDLR